jgi:hypothetical protein
MNYSGITEYGLNNISLVLWSLMKSNKLFEKNLIKEIKKFMPCDICHKFYFVEICETEFDKHIYQTCLCRTPEQRYLNNKKKEKKILEEQVKELNRQIGVIEHQVNTNRNIEHILLTDYTGFEVQYDISLTSQLSYKDELVEFQEIISFAVIRKNNRCNEIEYSELFKSYEQAKKYFNDMALSYIEKGYIRKN